MALSFSAGSVALANWGFSVGDIAVMAGADRDVDTVFTRKGLLDSAELQQRWDRKIVLLKNGQRTIFDNRPKGMVVEKLAMDRFTWLMTLIAAAVDATMQKTEQRKVLTQLMLKLFQDYDQSVDFIHREAEHHIQGWISAVCIRNIAAESRALWKACGDRGGHAAGSVPDAEVSAVVHFLYWLIHEQHNNRYSSASSDIFCIARILEHLGMKIRTVENFTANLHDEADVIFAKSSYVTPGGTFQAQPRFRPGLRLPLQRMQEVASGFPDNDESNKLRSLFEQGKAVVKADKISLQPGLSEDNPPRVKGSPFLSEDQDLMYYVVTESTETIPRLQGDDFRIANWLLPTVTPNAASALVELTEELSHSEDEAHNLRKPRWRRH